MQNTNFNHKKRMSYLISIREAREKASECVDARKLFIAQSFVDFDSNHESDGYSKETYSAPNPVEVRFKHDDKNNGNE